jgi:hypothetical protein
MVSRIKITVGLLLIHFLTSYTTCRNNCFGISLSFAISNRIYPDRDSISVGDTIWIEVDRPIRLTDKQRNTEVDYSGAVNLGSAIQLMKFGKVPLIDVMWRKPLIPLRHIL